MFEFFAENWVMTAIGATILLLAIAGVVYGVLTGGGWIDRGLMLRDGVRLRWPPHRIPLIVRVEDVPDEVRGAVEGAISEIVSAVGREIMRSYDPSPILSLAVAPDVSVFVGGVDAGGTADLTILENRIVAVEITISNTLELALLPRAVLHELLHALGLDHDESRSSVMHPELSTRPSRLTFSDVALLRRIYG